MRNIKKGMRYCPSLKSSKKWSPGSSRWSSRTLKPRNLWGSKKTFEEVLRKAGIPCQYFCRKSFATWDILLPTEEQAAKATANNIITKHFRLQPEYRGTRRLRVTVCIVPAVITGECLAAYLSAYVQVEEINLLRSPAGTAYGDYTFRLCLTTDGFKAILETLISGDRQMMVVVEGRRPRCWAGKEIGHIAKFCQQKGESTTAITTTATTTTISKQAEAQGPGQAQPQTSDQEGWTEVTRKRKGSPKQGEKSSSATSPPQKQSKALLPPAAVPEPPATLEPIKILSSPKVPETPTTPVKTASPAPSTPRKSRKKTKSTETSMETNANLKRRRDSGEGAAKNMPRKIPP